MSTQSEHEFQRSAFESRPILRVLVLLMVFCSSGATCTQSLRNPFTSVGPPAPAVLAVGASLEQVIAAVNENAARVQSFQTNNASITVPGMPAIPLLRGNIAVQRPGRMRLQASTALMGPEVDIGSGDEMFWFWVRRNEPPAVYFARHSQFVGSAAQQLMPVDPAWLLDALGLAQFAPGDHHQGPVPRSDGTLEITSFIQTRSGTFTKSTVVDATRAWVLEQHVYDSTGTLLASAVSRSYRYYPEAGVSLPRKVELNLPRAQLALTITLGSVQLNQLTNNPALWTLPVMAGYPQVDLGSARQNAAGPIGVLPPVAPQPSIYSPAPAPMVSQPIPSAVVYPAAAPRANVQRLPAGGISTQVDW